MLLLIAAAACSDLPVSPGASAAGGESAPSFSTAAARAPRDVPAVRIDLPPAPRPWDGDPVALESAIVTASGYAVVAFKEAGSARALAAGDRGAVTAGTVRAGLQLLERSGAEVIELLDAIGAARVRVTPAQAVALAAHPLVDFVEPRQYGRVQAQDTTWGVRMVGAPTYWPLNTGAGAKVLIIDTGHQQNHVDLPAIASANCAGVYGGCDDASTASWHGTRVLGIVAARNNLEGVVGVAPGTTAANIYMYGACDDYNGCPTDAVTAGINAGIFNTHVMNLSFTQPYDASQATAISQAWSNGIVIVAAAGNFASNDTVFPANYTNVIGVSGVNADKSFASSGTTGCNGYSNYGPHVDLSAPFSANSTIGGNGYGTLCGTSMATAHVTGVAALVKSANPGWTNQQVVNHLYATAEDRGTAGRDDYFGYGIVRAVRPPSANITGTSSITTAGTYTWQANASGGNGTYTYNWEYRVGTAAWTSVGTASSYSRTVALGNPAFELRVTVTSNGLNASDTHSVAVAPGTNITGTSNITTAGTYTWQANASGGNGTYTYSWQYRVQGTTTWTSVGTASSYSRAVALSDPAFELRVTVTSNGLSGSDTHSVAVTPPPVVNITGTTSITAAGTHTWQANASGGNGTYTYSWQYRVQGTTTWTTVGTASSYSRAVSLGDPAFELRVTVTSAGQTASDTHLVSVATAPLGVTVTGSDYLVGGETGTWLASATGGTGSYTYQWQYRGELSTTWSNGGTSSTYSRASLRSFYVRVIVTSGGASVTSSEFFVYVEPEPMCGDYKC
jgi:serine protease